MGEQGNTHKITRSVEWKLDLADLIMKVDNLPEDALKTFVKMMYSRTHEGAAAEGFQQINVDEAINQYGDAREALKRYLKPWFLLNIPLEGGSLGPASTDAPPIVQRVWKNLEKLLLHPLEDEVRIALEVQKRTNVFETTAKEYRDRLEGALKAFDKVPESRKQIIIELRDAYTSVERAANDIEDLKNRYDSEKSAHDQTEKRREQAEKRIETQEKQITGIREEAERLYKAQKDKVRETEAVVEKKNDLIKDLSAEVESAKTANEELGKKVESLEGELKAKSDEAKNERRSRRIYQVQSIKVRNEYDLKERDFIQVNEQANFERERKETAEKEAGEQRKRADSLENKLASTRQGRKGWYAAAAASILALGLLAYRPSVQTAPVENVPQEVINYSKDRITVKFGSALYDMSADRFSEIYQDIQKDQQKSGRQFTPAVRKQYFEKKAESTRQIK